MKKWKIVKNIALIILIAFMAYLVWDAILCTQMEYPHPMLGIDAFVWTDQFMMDLAFIIPIFGIPIVIDIAVLIMSIIKLKKYKNN